MRSLYKGKAVMYGLGQLCRIGSLFGDTVHFLDTFEKPQINMNLR